ncbi:methylmalonyl Co-A mutase-associated GTPase MeaB [Flaviaesturariibacter flavus]|uniref:Methylmalonyl Co-A mutase-associated GTPase MeaB n=1 Tax=Flaviaesturariibacter flavus TaxID=2502780 RepID=A0A4R1B7N7_9BACT|nr:methylmalonyl Co-A mutase-associated GTPase MeaB [Flaviaesturariibacter flavus]TCJ13107.1 methylmalonyl Co-A mutase-associated GTPase MeaB [Flaviaesturariibacter flavus]
MWQSLLAQLGSGDQRALARTLSFVENGIPGYRELLAALRWPAGVHVTGITGPPGAGKSTLTDGLIGALVDAGKKVAVLCVDPSSPFNLGAVLGDRIRMSRWYTHPSVFIRSLATRGSMGGLHPRIIELTDVLRAAGFDHVLVETVGVGQSEIEVAGLADTTVVVLVPEAGDEVQTMKAGLMEIADIFVVNKSDRPDAAVFIRNLRQMLAPAFSQHREEIPILATVAHEGKGLGELADAINRHGASHRYPARRSWLLAEKAWQLILQQRMQGLSHESLRAAIDAVPPEEFQLYRFVEEIMSRES